jgi:hypothetical protein
MTNSDGFADRHEFTVAAAIKVPRRVLLLGDSFAFGISASLQDFGLGELLDTFLDDGVETVVWNTALPGNGQAWQLDCLRNYGPLLRPNVIVATLFANDYSDVLYPKDQFYLFKGGERISRYAIARGGEVRLLTPEQAYLRAYAPRTPHELFKTLRTVTALVSLLRQIDYAMGTIVVRPNAALRHGLPEVTRLLSEIRIESETMGARFILLLIPERLDTVEISQSYAASQYICSQLRVRCIDPLPELTLSDYMRPPDRHWRDTGHAKAADLLVEAIEQ